MALGKPEFRHGRIVTAFLLGRNGKREEHPAIIISPDHEITQPEDFDPRLGSGLVAENLVGGIGISSKFRDFNDPFIVLPTGPTTGLVKECAAILNWYAVLDLPDDCNHLLGDVPSPLMLKINAAYRKHLQDRLGKLQGKITEVLKLLSEPQ